MSDQGPNPPRIAIKLGGTSSASRKKHTRPANIRRHRAHALGDDEDSGSSGSEDENNNNNKRSVRTEAITDLNWSTPNDNRSSHKRPNGRSEKKTPDNRQRDNQDDQPTSADPQEKDSKPVKWGLTINMKGSKSSSSKDPKDNLQQPPTTTTSSSNTPKSKSKSIDDEALDILLGNQPTKRKLPPSSDPSRSPEPEDYRTVPIDDFGATLLKSFGWDGKLRGKVKEVVPRHANLAGLGAKDAKGAEELTAWNQKLAGGRKDTRPPRLEDYTREERKKRQRVEEKYGDSYKREKERDRERERERGRDR